ncbi:protein bcp1 [Lasallia pustulata]|uniref:Protein BCP1 n=1 Tax=Lasallia pustulata TaxID=136370 RepID=A0A1W5DBP9_9LECA|nr:protein bcp1 [Lasallia pustulata]
MAKRKDLADGKARQQESEEESSSDEDLNMLDVEFEWFDPQPEYDFHGLKALLRQLFDVDAQIFDLSALTDIILAQPLLGSTVKVEGNETDPYAFLTVLNLHEHKDKPVIQELILYLARQAKTNPTLSPLTDLLSPSSEAKVGLILTERLINVPSEVVPPMYTMLLEEISWAIGDKEPYEFSHYLIPSKTYHEVASMLDQESRPPKKKKTKTKAASVQGDSEVFYFHPEDEVLQRHSAVFGGFQYEKQEGEGQSDARRTFQELGIKPQGHMILIEADKFEAAVNAIGEYLRST